MEKSISKRVLRAGLAGLLAVTGAAAGSGCASLGYPISKQETEYPFINPEKLRIRDKVFIMQEANKGFEWIWLK